MSGDGAGPPGKRQRRAVPEGPVLPKTQAAEETVAEALAAGPAVDEPGGEQWHEAELERMLGISPRATSRPSSRLS